MSFDTLTVGGSQSQTGSVTAIGASVTLSSASSSNSEFTLTGLTLPVTIAAGQSVPFAVTFAPIVAGTAFGRISFISNGSTLAAETASGTRGTSSTLSICRGMRAHRHRSPDITCTARLPA
jgi:hypothetical protein